MAEDQQERRTDLWSAYAAEGISSTSLSDRDQEIRELRQQVQDLTGVLETFSLTQRQISEHETRADWYSQYWKSWQDGWWHDQRWTQTPAVGSWWDDAKLSLNSWQDLDRWAAPSGYPSRKWDISEPPTFPGFSANYLMWRKAVLRWKMTTDHPVEKLGTKVMNSLDWDLHGSTSATRCCGVNLEGFGCQGRLDPGGRVQTPPAKGTVQRGKRQGRVSAEIHDKKVGADRGSLRNRSGYHANNHLGHC